LPTEPDFSLGHKSAIVEQQIRHAPLATFPARKRAVASRFDLRTNNGRAGKPPAPIRQGNNVKKYVVAASAAVGLAIFSGTAFAQVRGTVGASYDDENDIGVEGGLAIPSGGSLVVLLDADFARDDDVDANVYGVTGHLITRNSDHAWGGFVGLNRADTDFNDLDTWKVGGEYAKFLSSSTLVGRLSYSSTDDIDTDVWGLSGEYRYFANDNLRFDVGAGWSQIDSGFADDDAITLAGGAEYRFANSPISLGGNVGWINNDNDDTTVYGVTLRFDFGNDSLKDRDRNGGTFGTISSMIANILP
jgi:hypothetical protein